MVTESGRSLKRGFGRLGMSLKGRAIMITSALVAASFTVEAIVPVCLANSCNDCGPRLLATRTSCPALASCLARLPRCAPALTIPFLMPLPSLFPISCVQLPLGAGAQGGTLAKQLAKAGHEVRVAN